MESRFKKSRYYFRLRPSKIYGKVRKLYLQKCQKRNKNYSQHQPFSKQKTQKTKRRNFSLYSLSLCGFCFSQHLDFFLKISRIKLRQINILFMTNHQSLNNFSCFKRLIFWQVIYINGISLKSKINYSQTRKKDSGVNHNIRNIFYVNALNAL